MTVAELKVLIQELGLNDNGKVCLLIGYNPDDGEYYVVQVDGLGRLVIAP